MRFNKLLGTFKNGLISPRLRGTVENEKEVFNSAEELTNFYVDKVGAANKRAGLGDNNVFTSGTANAEHFEFTLLGTKYLFVFDNSRLFNQVDVSNNSQYLKIYLVEDVTIPSPAIPVKVLTGGTPSYVPPTNTNLAFYNGQYTTVGAFIDSRLGELISVPTDGIINFARITDRTIVFTSNGMSFSVSLLDKYTDSTIYTREFVMLPYFVSIPLFLQSYYGTTIVPTSSKCYISPTNFPFNDVNPNTSVTVNFAVLTSGGNNQQGSLPSDGVITKHNERFVWQATFNVAMPDSILGRFISVPNAASTKDVVFFITRRESSAQFTCIQVVGGTPLGGTSLWKLSSWGRDNAPKAVGYCFGRLIYGNSGLDTSKWWASAVHPTQPLYFQGFMQDNLRQDNTSDSSGLMYNDITTYTAGDFFRFGFSDEVPNGSEISWIKNRRRVHFGTLEGETQLEITSAGFAALSYTQTIVGTNAAKLAQAIEGDRKIFYIDDNSRDIRYISTEDRDYESVDGLVTTLLEGFGLSISKIGWFEKENILFFLATKKDGTKGLFGICLHTDTQIKAAFEFTFANSTILDFACGRNNIHVVTLVDGNTLVSKLDPSAEGFGDYYERYPDIYGGFGKSPLFANKLISIYFNGVVYENFQTGNAYPYFHTSTGADTLPFDLADTSEANPAYFYLSPITARIKTMPFNEGAQMGSSVGNVHRVDKVVFQLDNSGMMKAGESFSNMYNVEGLSHTPKTGLFKQDFPQSPDIESVLCIESTTPTPLHISGVSLRGVSYEGE